MNKSESTNSGLLGDLIEKESKVQFWMGFDHLSLPLALGWIHSMKHFYIQILCFNLSIDFK